MQCHYLVVQPWQYRYIPKHSNTVIILYRVTILYYISVALKLTVLGFFSLPDLYINSLTVGPVRSRRSAENTFGMYTGSGNVSRTVEDADKETLATEVKPKEEVEVSDDAPLEQRLQFLENKLESVMSAVASLQDTIGTLSEEVIEQQLS